MDANRGWLIISEDMVVKGIGWIRNCRRLQIYGCVEGDVTAGNAHIHKSAKCYGSMKSEDAEVHGTLPGSVIVKNQINVHSCGSVGGNVHYGKLALAAGGSQSAEVRNVSPSIGGGREPSVEKGHAVAIALHGA